MIVSSTRFKHRDVHWHQIDNVVIDGQYSSNVLDELTLRTANIDSDLYFIAAKARTSLSDAKTVSSNNRGKIDVEKLHSGCLLHEQSQLLLANV